MVNFAGERGRKKFYKFDGKKVRFQIISWRKIINFKFKTNDF